LRAVFSFRPLYRPFALARAWPYLPTTAILVVLPRHSREHVEHHAVDGIEYTGREVVGSSVSLGQAKAAMLRLNGSVGSAQQLSFLADVAPFLLES
jgi:hypothetical protein